MDIKCRFFAAFGIVLWLSACSSPEDLREQSLNLSFEQSQKQVELLKKHLSNNRIKNAKLLTHYAKELKKTKPEYREIVETLAEDATTKGAMFQSLVFRLDDAEIQMPSAKMAESAYIDLEGELNSIQTAAKVPNYNMMLTDPINVLADMSDGKLPRVSAMAKEASLAANQAKDLGEGSQLVGNPQYGNWVEKNGTSFWEFYGQYAFFSNLLSGPISYGLWSRNRNYSYYHDYGRRYYSSPSQKKKAQATEARVKKSFASKGKKFTSPYAKTKMSGASVRPKSVVGTPSKFRSQASSSQTSASKSGFSSKYSNFSKSTSSPQSTNSSRNSASYSSRKSTSFRSFGGGGK